MTPLKQRVDNALNEARVMVLVGQVLFAYAFEATFEKTFNTLPQVARHALLAGATLLVLALALLMTPAPFHCIVENGDDSEGFHGFVTGIVNLALPIFGAAMALVFFAMTSRVLGAAWAAGFGAFVAAAVLVFWEGLEHARRRA